MLHCLRLSVFAATIYMPGKFSAFFFWINGAANQLSPPSSSSTSCIEFHKLLYKVLRCVDINVVSYVLVLE